MKCGQCNDTGVVWVNNGELPYLCSCPLGVIPPISFSDDELDEIFKDLENDKPLTMGPEYGYKCSSCRDTGIIEVYGGPNRPCGCDWKC